MSAKTAVYEKSFTIDSSVVGTSPWYILPLVDSNVYYEYIPVTPGDEGRFEVTQAPREKVREANDNPSSPPPEVSPLPWAGDGIPSNGNVTTQTAGASLAITAFRMVQNTGAGIFNIRAIR